jgi:hypothetical protein
MQQDPPDHVAIGEEGQHLAPATAAITQQQHDTHPRGVHESVVVEALQTPWALT